MQPGKEDSRKRGSIKKIYDLDYQFLNHQKLGALKSYQSGALKELTM